jgi:hypothetical protein
MRIGSLNLFGYIDSAGGIRIAPRFDKAGEFSEGLAPAAESTGNRSLRYGFIDSSGSWVIHAQFRIARGFREGLAVASADGVRFGYLYPDGTWAIPPRFSDLSDFHGGFAVARMGPPISKDIPHEALLDRAGRWRMGGDFDALEYGGEGLVAVRKADKCGYAGTDGAIRIALAYGGCAGFQGGFAVVHPSRYEFDSVGLLKTDGNWAIGPVHGALGYLRDGLALMRSGPLGTDTSWGFVDASGTAAFAARFSAAREFSEGMAAAEARRDGRYKFGYIDRQGRWAITPRFDDAGDFRHGMARIRIGNAEGYVRRSGSLAWDPQDPRTGPIPPLRDPW